METKRHEMRAQLARCLDLHISHHSEHMENSAKKLAPFLAFMRLCVVTWFVVACVVPKLIRIILVAIGCFCLHRHQRILIILVVAFAEPCFASVLLPFGYSKC